ncbi:MAG: sacsin N-terminal ATP-binding-like domain-containing protein, partial [Candidatus Hodarchaeota archaeon]
MKDIEIKGLTEKQFEAYFYSLSDPNEQIAKLAEWRRYQSQVVSKFIDQIRLMANEQYTNLDHFLLELLQNADDNEYEKEVAPAVTILLTEKSFTLWNNEKGFNDRNLFAITYAAATTKFREKTGATFIGEKGIGFKSVFAVADYVDIHSDPYHFRLYNDEFIVPNALPSMPGKGTQIILKLRDSNKDIPQLLSNRLQTLCTSAQEFTLFLQKIEKLEVRDEVSGEEGKVTTLRDKDKGFYVVENNGREVSFITISYQEEIPEHIVKTRFREIDSDLNREIVFAIPLPPEDGAPLPRDGRLFCFLPTEVKTGTPIHVQVDAKTITNRENIASFDNSEWNRAVFKDFVPHMVSMYVSLTGREELEKYLPVYWPYDIDEIDINNKDLQSLIIQVKDELKNKEIVLDRHGTFQSPEFVRLLPDELYPFFYEDKFEKALSKYLVGDKEYQYEDGSKVEPEDVFTLVSESWAKAYEKQLMALGVEVIDENGQLAMFKGGAPDSVNILDDTEVRKLLELVMDYGQSLKKSTNWNKPEIGDLKSCSIFPVKSGDKRKWGPISSGVMWLQSDSPGARGSRKIAIVDPAFTYSPGGGGTKKQEIEEVREFNKRFRDFLTDDLDIPPFSIAEFQRRTTIKELQSTSVDVNDLENRRKINEEWVQLYSQIWKRRKTILREKGEEYWKEILKEISQCKIPTRTAGENVWQLGIVSLAFIGAQFKTEDNLDKIYAGTGAPIITLDFIQRNTKSIKNKRQRRVDWEDWREFLTACEAEQGPFLENVDLSRQDRYSASYSSAYQDPQNQLGNAIKEGVNSHWEYKAEGGRSFYLSANSITVTIDNWSQKLLGSLT